LREIIFWRSASLGGNNGINSLETFIPMLLNPESSIWDPGVPPSGISTWRGDRKVR